MLLIHSQQIYMKKSNFSSNLTRRIGNAIIELSMWLSNKFLSFLHFLHHKGCISRKPRASYLLTPSDSYLGHQFGLPNNFSSNCLVVFGAHQAITQTHPRANLVLNLKKGCNVYFLPVLYRLVIYSVPCCGF